MNDFSKLPKIRTVRKGAAQAGLSASYASDRNVETATRFGIQSAPYSAEARRRDIEWIRGLKVAEGWDTNSKTAGS